LLNGFTPCSDEERRKLYVALTRAKNNLTIHYNDDYLRRITAENFTYDYNSTAYDDVEQIALLLNHKDVQLGYFEFVQHRIGSLHSGESLTILEDGFGNKYREKVVHFSQKFRNTLSEWAAKGFKIEKANINFIVYWKDEKKDVEVKILLPELFLCKYN